MKKLFFKLLHNQTGFSLTEVMVGGAILAGIAITGTKIFRDQRYAQKNVENDQHLALFHQGLIKTLSNTATCNATFKAWYGTPIPATALSIYKCDPLLSNCDNRKLDANGIVKATPPIWDITLPDRWISPQRIWKITNIEVASAVTSTGPLKLRVTYQLNPSLPNPRQVIREILISVRFNNGGGFKECVNNQDTSLNNLQNDICKTMNMNMVTSAGHIAQWNEDSQSCEMIDTGKTCPAGYVIEGIRSDGSVHCATATQNLGNDNSLNSTGPKNCPTGTKIVFTGGTFEIVCN